MRTVYGYDYAEDRRLAVDCNVRHLDGLVCEFINSMCHHKDVIM